MKQPHLPASAGVGFKPEHFHALRQDKRRVDFFEVHAENYMGAGGLPHAQLTALRSDYALSVHGVGLSIGANGPLDHDHLMRVKALCDHYAPESFSEHLAWSSHGGAYLNDLLPLPYTMQTLDQVCDHIDEVQTVLGRRMLLENPSTYVRFRNSTITETSFITEVVRRTGCGLLLDVNNVFVSCTNHGEDAHDYLDALPLNAVGEIHLGGYDREELSSGPLLIDSHGSAVDANVWALFDRVLSKTGPVATLVEWDNDVPDWPVLAQEADRVHRHLSDAGQRHAVA